MAKRETPTEPDQFIPNILNEYDEQCHLLQEFTSVTERLILDLLTSNSLPVHSVTSRLKTKASISDKVKKAQEDTYRHLRDIGDICGIRIITYYPDGVDAVAEVIRKEFSIDYASSDDKRAILDPDRFGYLSVHYTAQLPLQRLHLTEYSRFQGCKTEIQIRSILQHTWAEIEHDLGYKTNLAVPRHIRRRFSQLAGLLELADDTFVQIRQTLADYESNLPDIIDKTPELVQIDQASLLTFVERSKILARVDKEIASRVGAPLTQDPFSSFLMTLIPRLNYVNIKSIAELSKHLDTLKDEIVRIAPRILSETAPADRSQRRLVRGVAILYVFHLLLLKRSPDISALGRELLNAGIDATHAKTTAERLLRAYKAE